MYSTPAHSANKALSASSKSSSLHLLSAVAIAHPYARIIENNTTGGGEKEEEEEGGDVVAWSRRWLPAKTTRTCASFCKLDRIHALNHRGDKFLHTRMHSLGAGDDEITRETPNLQTTALSKNKMERWRLSSARLAFSEPRSLIVSNRTIWWFVETAIPPLIEALNWAAFS